MDFLPSIRGHREPREELQKWLRSGRLPAGMLFFGSKGRGRRTLAHAFASALLAGDPRTGVIDPQSSGAAKLRAGNHPDLEIVASKEEQRLIGIDQIRSLKQAFSLTPVEAPRRVALVLNADELSQESGNALLKLLEEPPPASHLILTASAKDSIMETLVSRCRALRIPNISPGDVQAILKQEGLPLNLAQRLGRMSEGRPGVAMEWYGALSKDPSSEPGEGSPLALLTQAVLGAQAPSETAENLSQSFRKGTKKAEGARQNARTLLDLAGWHLRVALRAQLGGTTVEADLAVMDSQVRARLCELPPHALERALAALLLAQRDLKRNVGLELVFSNFLASLRSA